MQRIINYPVFIFLCCVSCTGNNTISQATDSGVKKQQNTVIKTAETDKMIAGDENSFISETNRNEMLLFGRTLEVLPSELRNFLSPTIIEMNRLMSNSKTAATGPLTFVYLTMPGSGIQKIFIGQPVKSRFKSGGQFTFLYVRGGVFYKMVCNAETGNTAGEHQKMQAMLKSSSLDFSLPVLEVFSESRNNEMTVVSKATLLYPKKIR